jgi:REP element-mobilizing transposase RayT
MRPHPLTNDIFLYCLALAAERHGIIVHAVCVMSNHYHAVVTDTRGVLPRFLEYCHGTLARALNASQGQWESLWDPRQTNVLLLARAEDVLRKIAYVVANPVDAGLVAHPHEWPGVLEWTPKTLRIARPDVYFDPAGDSPATVELVIAPPPAASEMPAWNDALNAEVRLNVEAAHRSMRANGMTFLGAAAVKNASFLQRAKSYEDRRQIVPKIAAINREVRVVMLRTYRAFHGLYRAALDAWRTGDREVVFPHGTWWMADFHGAAVAVTVPTVVLAGDALELEEEAGGGPRGGGLSCVGTTRRLGRGASWPLPFCAS